MNYYPFHLGDYTADTAHLEPMEDLAYRRMLDLYYRTEKSLPHDASEVARLIRLRSEVAAVQAVLTEFFTQWSEGWCHERCEAELARMREKQAKARASASARYANAERTQSERRAEALLPTPTPTPNNPPSPLPGGFVAFWNAWPQHHRKAGKPQCLRKWQGKGCEAIADRIVSAVNAAKRSAEWTKDGGAYIPAPLAWLNQERWEAPITAEIAAPPVEVWKGPPPMTPEEKAAANEARIRALGAVKRISA